MPGTLSPTRRLATAARWPAGVSLTAWRYMWRTTPFHRSEQPGTPDEDSPPPLDAGVETDDVQWPVDGVGPLFHRRYRARIRQAGRSPEELMALLQADPDAAAPGEFATFIKVAGEEERMRVGDEFLVRMAGPWDGPVRVVALGPTSFRLATLAGHLEAGQIEFGAHEEDGYLVVTVESWARSGDRLAHVLYHKLRMAKEVQLHMWISYLERIVDLAGGRLTGGISIETRRVEEAVDAP